MSTQVSENAALDDLRQVARDIGHPPTVAEYREHGEYSRPTVARHFDGSFVAARKAALKDDTEHRRQYSDNELLADINRVAEDVGREPSKDDYKEYGDHALSTITYRFPSWVKAKKLAGVYEGLNEGPTKAELIEDMQRVDAEQSGPLSQKVYDTHGQWTSMTAKRRFPSWEEACEIAAVARPPHSKPTKELYDDIRRVAEKLKRVPSKTDYDAHGKFSQQMAKGRAGSWNDAVRKSGFEPNAPGAQPGDRNANWEGGYEPYYGLNWHEQRRAARRRDGYECVACGLSESEHLSVLGWGLEVHHIIPVRRFRDHEAPDIEDSNRLRNLITLCRPHHREYEGLPSQRAIELKEGG